MKTFFILMTIVVALQAQAERHDQRQKNQHARIRDGVKDGSLTRGEAMRARAGQRHVRRLEKKAEADGAVSADEALKLEQAQDRQSKRIHRMKHNQKVRASEPSSAGDSASP